MAPGSSPPVRSVSRALSLLRCLDGDHPARSLGDLAEAVDLPKSTVLRLVAALEADGMLWTRPDGQVAAGAGLLRWATLALDVWSVPATALRLLQEAALDVGESVSLQVRQGLSRVVVARVEGPRALRHVLRVGDVLPLTAGAASWVLLAGAGSAGREHRAVAEVASRAPSGRDVVALVRRARERGHAVSDGEREDGVTGVAVPVLLRHGVAALAVGGPSARIGPDAVSHLVGALPEVAAKLQPHLHGIGTASS